VSIPQDYETLRRDLFEGRTNCRTVTEQYLAIIEQKKHLNAFLSVNSDDALGQADLIDKKLAAGDAGTLAGMAVAVKDNMCIRGGPATCASKILEDFRSLYDATVIQKLHDADAIVIGKTNLDEFAMGSSTENSAFGPVKNPVDESRVPGGSSGGSCVAVAAGMATTALGSDTGGSIRQPAAFCGIVGLKPTYGRVSRYGLVALSSSFDQIGPFARTVRDAATVLNVIAGHDPHDSTSAKIQVPDYTATLTHGVKGLRIGIAHEAFGEGLQDDTRQAIEQTLDLLRAQGAIVEEVSLPHSEYTTATYYILMTADASSNLARYDGARYGYRTARANDLSEMYTKSRSEGFGSEVKRRIMLGTYALSAGYYDAYYRKAQKVRRLIQDDFFVAYKKVDCIISPVSPTTAFRCGEKTDDPLQMYLSDIYTVSANLAGIPAISLPCGKDREGLPIGLQISGKQFDEATVLRCAESIQSLVMQI
jgi:aspartyl-tRNA(Asn)/glutamyl-tRNA(Gln) amidotransferase subunit A